MSHSSEKLILVTGGSRGLGLATVKRLAKDGYRVIAASRSCTPELHALTQSASVFFHEFDLGNHAEIHPFVSSIVKQHGHLYGLINNAAVGHDGILATMHDSQVESLVAINLTGTLLLTKYAVRSMLLKQQGRIVNVSSIIATTGFKGLSVYAATKAALNGFSKSLAREVGKANITVNTVAPGYMATDMTGDLQGEKLESIKRRSPMGRLATVEDAAGSILWLMGDDAASITGTTITVDAGSTA